MRKFKIKWLNVIKALLFIISILVLSNMLFTLIISGLSWFGIYLLFMSGSTAGSILLDFKEQIEKMSSTRNTKHLRIRYN